MAKKPPRRASKKVAPPKVKVVNTGRSVADRLPEVTPEQERRARARFVEVVVQRGEAVPEGKPLPPGATHVITGQDADGNPVIKRKRFSAR